MSKSKSNPSIEDRKEMIVDYLRKQANDSHYWFSTTQIAKGLKIAYITAWEAVKQLVSEGFLNIRDGDTENQKILIALKPSLRDKTYHQIHRERKEKEQ